MQKRTQLVLGLASLLIAPFGCGAVDDDDGEHGAATVGLYDSKSDSSLVATIMDFEWDGAYEVSGEIWGDGRDLIESQLYYTVGQLNGESSVGRMDKAEFSNIQKMPIADGKTRVTFHAKMPVAWGSKTNLPSTFTFKLPKDPQGFGKFTESYVHSCVEAGAHDVDEDSMWYYYRPAVRGCNIAPQDVIESVATARRSALNTTATYPEYHKVWEDDELRAVVIFGKDKPEATQYDPGISAYNEFVDLVRARLMSLELRTTPANLAEQPGVAQPDVQLEGRLPDGKKVIVNVLLVPEVSSASQAFYDRYEALSTRADFIAYNGHAGLGKNIRTLATKGKFVPGQYVIIFMNGCDTYTYVDESLAATRSSLNPGDESGIKYMDYILNAMPAYFHRNAEASMSILSGLMKVEAPLTYEAMFEGINHEHVTLVSGDQGNEFRIGMPIGSGGGSGGGWAGLDEIGKVNKRQELRRETPTLQPGVYQFELSGNGDADLYVRKGKAPTTRTYDCRPYVDGSQERCELRLTAPAVVHVMVRGYAAQSDFRLTGRKN